MESFLFGFEGYYFNQENLKSSLYQFGKARTNSRATRLNPKSQAVMKKLLNEPKIDVFQFNALFGYSPYGLALYQLIYDENQTPVDFIHLEFNKAYEKILGINRQQTLGKPVSQTYLDLKNEPVDWIGLFGRVASSMVPEYFEVSCPNTQNCYQTCVYSPKKGYCIAVLVDITEQKKKTAQEFAERQKAEALLQEKAEKYQHLVKHAPTAIYEISIPELKFVSVNDVMCMTTGYSEQELLAMNPLDLLYEESKKRFQEQLKCVLCGKEIDESVEYHVKTKDGSGLWGIFNLELTYKNGKVNGALIVAHDVTARKKAEQELVSAEKMYRRLYETTQDGIMARDLEGKMIDCNQAYAKMLGYSKKELKNLTVQQLLPKKWHGQRERIVKRVIQTGHSVVFEREYKRRDGSVFSASVRSWRLTDGKGKVIGLWSILRDITEQKQRQKNLEKHADSMKKLADEAIKALKDSERLVAIGQTAGMVGHDLRNPLQTVIGELYLAKSEVDLLADDERKRNLQESIRTIEEQAVYMDKIVSDLQAFVRPLKIEKKVFALKELVDSVFESVVVPKDIAVRTQIEDGFPKIEADFQLLKRVLINLVTNAIQAMPEGGKLTLTAQINQGLARVTVRDTGVGIAEDVKCHIFTPLFTTKSRGQGFGLAVCKRVMEAHRGSITFESTCGKGAEFSIVFPAG